MLAIVTFGEDLEILTNYPVSDMEVLVDRRHHDIVTGRPVIGDHWVAFGRTNEGVTIYDRSTGDHRTTWSRTEYEFGISDGLVPVKDGFMVRESSTSGFVMLR